jgi:CMP-N-acetylneuraminic acid synthetase
MPLSQFENLINGKTVAIVGNQTITENLSDEIDAHDIVIRLNHFYNYDSGNVGKKVSAIFATPTPFWAEMGPEERHQDIIQEQKPLVFILKHEQRINEKIISNHYKGCKIYGFTPDYIKNEGIYTTGTCALNVLSQCINFQCDVYGFSFEKDWKSYISSSALHYFKTYKEEEPKRLEYIEEIKKKKIFLPAGQIPEFHPVIPVRKGSSLKDKNIREYKGKPLLQHAIEKALKVFGKVTVLSDNEEYAKLARQWGAEVPYIDERVDDLENIVVRLKRWRDIENINGRIILIQCTSPNITEESLYKIIEESKDKTYRDVIGSVSLFNDIKYSALMFKSEKGFLVQAISGAPDISVPRQSLKPLYYYNGGITSFFHTQLDYDVLFKYSYFYPLMIDETESLDIDNENDFKK